MRLVHSANGHAPYSHVFGFYAEDNDHPHLMENHTYQMMDWCNENIGPEFEKWYIMSNAYQTMVYFCDEQAAAYFKLCNS